MKRTFLAGILALMILLLALPGAVSAGDSLTASGTILPPAPVAAFSASPLVGVAPLDVTFTDASTGTIDSWNWEYRLGSGSWTSFATTQNPDFQLAVAGPYDIRLTVTNHWWKQHGNQDALYRGCNRTRTADYRSERHRNR